MKGRLVRVRWHDAHSCGDGWQAIEEIDTEPYVVDSIGYAIVDAKPGHIVLAASASDDAVDHVLAIPHGMVREVVELIDGARIPLEHLR